MNLSPYSCSSFGNSSYLLDESGSLVCAGLDRHGQLGRARPNTGLKLSRSFEEVKLPLSLESGFFCQGTDVEGVSQFAAGEDFFLVVSRDGTLYSCGNNSHCQLGVSSPEQRFVLAKVCSILF